MVFWYSLCPKSKHPPTPPHLCAQQTSAIIEHRIGTAGRSLYWSRTGLCDPGAERRHSSLCGPAYGDEYGPPAVVTPAPAVTLYGPNGGYFGAPLSAYAAPRPPVPCPITEAVVASRATATAGPGNPATEPRNASGGPHRGGPLLAGPRALHVLLAGLASDRAWTNPYSLDGLAPPAAGIPRRLIVSNPRRDAVRYVMCNKRNREAIHEQSCGSSN